MYDNWDRMMDFGSHLLAGWGFGSLPLWSLFWKGLALWKSARNDERYWFVTLLVINTAGILEMLYLFLFAKTKYILVSEPTKTKKPAKKK
ncbi:MAG: hypothetical protein DPW11_04550 [bacterium]|nr:hypothetical protein [Candidatus Microgenomates bacterium CPR3]MCQ3945014.1 hypothetical protein [bacterium]RIK51698.1 MAG: hypothetical protein DCC61_02020 [Candidatus Microgenomates bacterium]